ncbi:S-layer homology domain-containing protein [Calderihabitans maritimus]|uniref:S-layer domain-containing protein n=1 Tax=Calderihabitans maritimus TaxID=1246530 RepID=A0A1Z5HSC8_9FIRM|nr:S-layer homology domain-containing protein [Calderihabitans maritimus]GAW92429.1 S-layer domain-containing protein [Calderihabitans maritimus]
MIEKLNRRLFAGVLAVAIMLIFGAQMAWAGNVLIFRDVKAGHWAEKAIAEMKFKGVIKGISQTEFGVNDNVKRQEVVVMLIRVLGLEEEAKGKELPISFGNPEAVAPWAREAVALAVEKGIIAGGDLWDFRPQEEAKRWEVAVLAVRAMGLREEAGSKEGAALEFTDTQGLLPWIKGYIAVAVEKGIFRGDASQTFRPNDPITRGEMAVILARLDDQLKKLEGKVQKGEVFSKSPSASVIILKTADGVYRSVSVDNNVFVYREGQRISWTELQPSEKIAYILNEQQKAQYIEVIKKEDFQWEEEEKDVEGTISEVKTGERASITIRLGDGTETTYYLTADTDIYLDYREAEIEDLVSGQEAKLTVKGSEIIKIFATSFEREVEGTLVKVEFVPQTTITVETEEEGTKTFPVAEDEELRVRKDGDRVSLRELYPGDLVELELKNEVVQRIYAETVENEVSGTVRAVTIADNSRIDISTEDGEEVSYDLAPEVVIEKDGKRIEVNELKPGDYVVATVSGERIISMEVEARIVADYLMEEIENINEEAGVIVLKDVNKPVFVDDDTVIYRFGERVDLDDLQPEDTIIAVGRLKSGILEAEIVVVLISKE